MPKHSPDFLAGYETAKADIRKTILHTIEGIDDRTQGLKLGKSLMFALQCLEEAIRPLTPGDKK